MNSLANKIVTPILSDLSFNFKQITDFKLTNIAKVKSNNILSTLSPITDEPFVSFMQKLDKMYNQYNFSFHLWLKTVENICSTIVAIQSSDIFVHLAKCDKDCY